VTCVKEVCSFGRIPPFCLCFSFTRSLKVFELSQRCASRHQIKTNLGNKKRERKREERREKREERREKREERKEKREKRKEKEKEKEKYIQKDELPKGQFYHEKPSKNPLQPLRISSIPPFLLLSSSTYFILDGSKLSLFSQHLKAAT